MARDVEQLVLQLSADVRAMERGVASAARAANGAAAKIEKRFEAMNRKVAADFQQLSASASSALAAIGVTVVSRAAQQIADEWTTTANKISSAGVALKDVAAVQKQLADLAVATRSDFSSTVTLFSRLARTSDSLGASQGDVLRVTETLNKAFKVGGATGQEAAASVLQLGQALSSGVLQGDEFRTLTEAAPTEILEAIAKEFGVARGQLKKLAADGELVAPRVFRAILNVSSEIDTKFAKTTGTISESFTNLATRVGEYISQSDKATGATRTLSGFINGLADNIDALADAFVVAGAAALGAYGAQLAVVASKALATGSVIATLNKTLTATNLGVLAISLVVSGLALLAARTSEARLQQDAARTVAQQYKEDLAKLETAITGVTEATAENRQAAENAARADLQAIQRKFDLAKANIAAAQASLKLQEARAGELAQLAALAGGGQFAAPGADAGSLAVGAGRAQIAQQHRELDALGAAIDEKKRALDAAINANRRPPPAPSAPAGGRARAHSQDKTHAANEVARVARVKLRTQQQEAADQKRRDSAERAAEAIRRAGEIADGAPESTRQLRAELKELDGLLTSGVFAKIGAEREGAKAYADLLEQIAAKGGDVAELLAQLSRLTGLNADEAESAARRIKDAASAASAQRDEDLGRIFRTREIKDDVRSALHEAFKTGDYADVFRERIADALERAADRSLDKVIDAIIDPIFNRIGNNGGGKKSSGGGGNLLSSVISAVASLFGGKRAAGGPVQPGRVYRVGEKGEELFAPNVSGRIIPNNIVTAAQRPVQPVNRYTRQEITVAYTINLEGANGDETIRAISRQEARRGVAEGLRIADLNAPGRNARFQKLGT